MAPQSRTVILLLLELGKAGLLRELGAGILRDFAVFVAKWAARQHRYGAPVALRLSRDASGSGGGKQHEPDRQESEHHGILGDLVFPSNRLTTECRGSCRSALRDQIGQRLA